MKSVCLKCECVLWSNEVSKKKLMLIHEKFSSNEMNYFYLQSFIIAFINSVANCLFCVTFE